MGCGEWSRRVDLFRAGCTGFEYDADASRDFLRLARVVACEAFLVQMYGQAGTVDGRLQALLAEEVRNPENLSDHARTFELLAVHHTALADAIFMAGCRLTAAQGRWG